MLTTGAPVGGMGRGFESLQRVKRRTALCTFVHSFTEKRPASRNLHARAREAAGGGPVKSLANGSRRTAPSLRFHKRTLFRGKKRAMVAASLANMPRGGVREGQNTITSQTANLQDEVSQTQAAELLQVSPRSVATAAKVERSAPAEVISRAG